MAMSQLLPQALAGNKFHSRVLSCAVYNRIDEVGLSFVQPFDTIQRLYLVRGKSCGLSPKPASTSSMGMPLPSRWANQTCPS